MKKPTRQTVKLLFHEISKFGIVGIIGIVIDVGLFNVFLLLGLWASVAKTLSMTVAMLFTYTGNKYWSFRQRSTLDRTPAKTSTTASAKQFALFLIVNFIALSFSLIALYVEHEILGIRSLLADNIAANVIGLGSGTIFRFFAYRLWVFPQQTGETQVEKQVRERQIFSPEI